MSDKPRRSQPLWETIVIGGSFPVLWIWWLARQAALREGETQAIWWHGVLLVVLIALLVVLARRMKRVARAFRGEYDDEDISQTPPIPPIPPPPDRHGGPDKRNPRSK